MFTGNMVTEAIPKRVYSLYRIATSKKEITRAEIHEMMEPEEIYEGISYFSTILKVATELRLVEVQDNIVIPLVEKEQLKNIDEFRLYTISKLESFQDEQFYKCTNAIVNMNDDVYKYSLISDSGMLKILSTSVEQQVTAPMVRGWRFWAQFLGFGNMNKMAFLPNAYIFVKGVLKMINLEKNKEYKIDEFMVRFNQYGKILSGNLQPERNLNIAFSSALRELHDNGEIELVYSSDAESRWVLFPSNEAFNKQVASIIYKGVKR